MAVLNKEQVAFYRTNGYLVVDLLTSDDVDGFLVSQEAETPEDVRALGLKRYQADESWASIGHHPKVTAIVSELIDGDPRIVQTMYMAKSPEGGTGVALHQDTHYIRNEPNTLMACWIALSDTAQLNDEATLWAEDFLAQQVEEHEEYRFELGIAPDELRALAGRLALAWSHQLELAQRLEAALDNRRDEIEIAQRDALDAYLVNAQGMVVRAQGQVDLWRSYDGASSQDLNDPWVRWLRQSRTGNGIDFLASPILARDLLREHIWQRAAGVVMTSATLSSLGSFDRLQAMTGLPDGARYKRVESPFNTKQAVFSIPALQQEPGDADAHTAEIIECLPELIANDLGVLVLFSSRRQMEAVVMGLEGVLPHRMLVQDSLSKSLLLETHRQTIDENQPSVIMGLASFAEGVDLPGAYCTHVVIAKLPFAVPDNPRDAAHAELLEQQGRNAFMEISVPDAALKLVQASGRLLRTEEDSGRITLLDRRLLTRRYGRAILESLPRYRFDLATGQAD